MPGGGTAGTYVPRERPRTYPLFVYILHLLNSADKEKIYKLGTSTHGLMSNDADINSDSEEYLMLLSSWPAAECIELSTTEWYFKPRPGCNCTWVELAMGL